MLPGSKKQSKRSNSREEEAERYRAQELEDAKTEWTRCGYPKIGWRRLNSRLNDFFFCPSGYLDGSSRASWWGQPRWMQPCVAIRDRSSNAHLAGLSAPWQALICVAPSPGIFRALEDRCACKSIYKSLKYLCLSTSFNARLNFFTKPFNFYQDTESSDNTSTTLVTRRRTLNP